MQHGMKMAAALALSAILSSSLPKAMLFDLTQIGTPVHVNLTAEVVTSVPNIKNRQNRQINYQLLIDPELTGLRSAVDLYHLQASSLLYHAIDVENTCKDTALKINSALINSDIEEEIDYNSDLIANIRDILSPLVPIVEKKISELEENNKNIHKYVENIYSKFNIITDIFMNVSKKMNVIEYRSLEFKDLLQEFCLQSRLNSTALNDAVIAQKELIYALKNALEAIKMNKFEVSIVEGVVFDNEIDPKLYNIIEDRINDNSEFIVMSFEDLEADISDD